MLFCISAHGSAFPVEAGRARGCRGVNSRGAGQKEAAAIAGASALLSSFEASSAVTRSSSDWMAAALLPEAAVFTARSVTCA